MPKIKKCRIINCDDKPELSGLIIEIMPIEEKFTDKNTKRKGKPKQPSIRDMVASLSQTVASMQIEMREGFKNVNARIDNLEKRLENVIVKNNLVE
ncbi:MAG: hypothetical protein LBM76_00170 [Mycoplasmataceae bacterium]|jgi:hypothetical protein|nr:hypothetical protein [Mycoplasmataceae bacterium]